MDINNTVTKEFHWLKKDGAKKIMAICKNHGATVQRLAESRGLLGIIKVRARFNRYPGWCDNSNAARSAINEISQTNIQYMDN